MSQLAPSTLDPSQLAAIHEICRRFRVRTLELFGSATTEKYDRSRSDLDFLFEFEPGSGDEFVRFFDFLSSLETTLGRSVDLVDASQIRNPYFRRKVDQQRQLIYAA